MNVFDFAMDVERSGSRFYRRLAGRTDHPGLKTIFTMMARDEETLRERFRAMKNTAQAATMADSSCLEKGRNPFDETLDEQEALRLCDDLEAYDYVIRVEEDICRLYEDAARCESRDEVRDLLLGIAAEERSELASLRKIHDFVNAPNEYLAWQEFSNLDEFHNFGRDEDL